VTATDNGAVVDRLRAAGCVFAEDEAALLLDAADGPGDLERLLARRVAGEPLEQVLGWADFRGLRVLVGPGVFVPRRRTAFLVDLALHLLGGRSQPVVVDLCCGTGAIAAAVLAEAPAAEVHAADLDPRAVAAARLNVEPRGGRVHEGDLYDALPGDLRGRVDLLAVNAPYVPSDAIATMPPEARDHEARLALDGGMDGLDVHRRVAADARDWLAPGGHLLIETGLAQAPVARDLFRRHGLSATVEHSEDHDATVVIGSA
jgi:release factor glutamine methyltransferase